MEETDGGTLTHGNEERRVAEDGSESKVAEGPDPSEQDEERNRDKGDDRLLGACAVDGDEGKCE